MKPLAISSRLKKDYKVFNFDLSDNELGPDWAGPHNGGLNIEQFRQGPPRENISGYITTEGRLVLSSNERSNGYCSTIGDVHICDNFHFDIIAIHGYVLRDLGDPYKDEKMLDWFNSFNFTCEDFIVDYAGENLNPMRVNVWDKVLKKMNLVYKRKRIISSTDSMFKEEQEKNIGKEWDIFRFPFNGARWIGGYNSTYNQPSYQDGILIKGISWQPEYKNKLFSCVNNHMRPHRTSLVSELVKSDLLDDGYVVCNKNKWVDNRDIKEEGILIVKCGDGIDDGTVNVTDFRYYRGIIEEDTEDFSSSLIKRMVEESDTTDIRFTFQPFFASRAYIGVSSELSYTFNSPSFYAQEVFAGLQFPIFYGAKGTIQYYRDYGFDMFDDIINHDYDDVFISPGSTKFGDFVRQDFDPVFEMNKNREDISAYFTTKKLNRKSKLIVKELIRLRDLDIPSLYLENKDRFLANQERVFKLLNEENNRSESLGKWIFGDNIEFQRDDNFKILTWASKGSNKNE